ncbi:DUF4189 domain-containing protein [Xanthomonas euvesicatoria]|uniref:DUF4189 domain-containing protein n=1 Tax=Xanthomonas euvesicatoria TaxID=456327 RepID=UPI00298E93AF|nr:DUF4189 domain-containing protein [Xanthomonas euvesicatoria]MDW7716886.1 DUF4189 domain-containing protein [Xanthomonas euvesicatoria]
MLGAESALLHVRPLGFTDFIASAGTAQWGQVRGKNCKDWAAYENQCAAVAEPYKDGRSSAGSLHFRTGASAEDIQREVKDICSSENNGECRVIYAACSEPIFQRY